MPNYQSKYSIAFFDPEHSITKLSWFTSSEELSESGLKEEMNKILEYIKQDKPTKVIVDTVNFRYQVTQSIQNWIVSEFINKVFLLGVQKYAIVVDEEVFDEVSVQQIADDEESDENPALIQYFLDEEEAFEWMEKI